MDTSFVFVVDDEPGIALLCNRLLTRAGYKLKPKHPRAKPSNFSKRTK